MFLRRQLIFHNRFKDYKIVFLNQSILGRSWQLDLQVDLAQTSGPCFSYSTVENAKCIGNLTIQSTPFYHKKSRLSRVFSWLSYFIYTSFHIIFSHAKPFPLLFIFSNPQIMPWFGYLMKRIFRQKYVVLVLDIYPDILVRMEILSEKNFLTKIWRYMNHLAFHNADHIFTLTEIMKRNIEPMVSNDGSKPHPPITVIPPGVDTNWIRPLSKEHNRFALSYKQESKFTLIYSGNLGTVHDTDTIISSIKILKDDVKIHFMFIVQGSKKTLLKKEIKRHDLSNVTLLPFQDETVLPYSLTSGDVAIVTLDKRVDGLCIPGKVITMMSAGLAILAICDPDGELANIVVKTGCGMTVPPGDIEGFVSAVRTFKSNKDLLRQCQENSRKAASEHFSREVIFKQYLNVIIPLIEQKS
ncbi:glycosyltransferase family 4 protein [Candidatus Latescibacterota bacterium]